jgi:hypothetical protein
MLWVDIQKLVVTTKPYMNKVEVPKNPVRKAMYHLAGSIYFESFIMICIVLNMVQMAIIYEGASDTYVATLEVVNLVFTGIFVMEAVVKITGLGPSAYFYEAWNKFDFFVVASSLVDIMLEYFSGSGFAMLRIGP